MISLNSNLSGLKRSGIRRFTNLARQTPGCAMLTIGEPDFDTPAPICAAAAASIAAGHTHYAPNQGTTSLREAIAAFETNRGFPVKPEQVLVTVGATGALFTALLGILNPGEEVIIPTPAFSLYETIVTIAGGVPVPMDLTETGFQISPEALEKRITPKTKAIVLNSPNNPTGTVLGEDSLSCVRQAALKHDFFVLCDQVYNQLTYAPCPDLTLEPGLEDRLMLIQSFSKPYAMTGWRVGYLIAPEAILERLLLLSAAEIAAVPTFLQDAAEAALKQDSTPFREEYRRRRDYVCGRLTGMGLHYPAPEGAFYVFPEIRPFGMDSETFCTRLIQEGRLAAVPGSCFGTEGYIRLSYCYCMEELAVGLNRLEDFLHKCSR